MICKDCDKSFDCTEPCKKAIAWEELTQDDRLDGKYQSKGVSMYWVNLDGKSPNERFKNEIKR